MTFEGDSDSEMLESQNNSTMVAPGLHDSAAHQVRLLRIFELPALYREVVMLREVQGRSVAEIATVLGISRDAVRKRLRRARRMWTD